MRWRYVGRATFGALDRRGRRRAAGFRGARLTPLARNPSRPGKCCRAWRVSGVVLGRVARRRAGSRLDRGRVVPAGRPGLGRRREARRGDSSKRRGGTSSGRSCGPTPPGPWHWSSPGRCSNPAYRWCSAYDGRSLIRRCSRRCSREVGALSPRRHSRWERWRWPRSSTCCQLVGHSTPWELPEESCLSPRPGKRLRGRSVGVRWALARRACVGVVAGRGTGGRHVQTGKRTQNGGFVPARPLIQGYLTHALIVALAAVGVDLGLSSDSDGLDAARRDAGSIGWRRGPKRCRRWRYRRGHAGAFPEGVRMIADTFPASHWRPSPAELLKSLADFVDVDRTPWVALIFAVAGDLSPIGPHGVRAPRA